MKTSFLIFLLLCKACCFAQHGEIVGIDSGISKELIKHLMRFTNTDRLASPYDTSCSGYYTGLANEDIANGHPKLLVSRSQVRRSYADAEFEERYHISMQIFGNILFDEKECLEAYNERIFLHLDSTCSKNWRLDASRSANSIIGFKQFVKKQPPR
jgi:hypothetical protein